MTFQNPEGRVSLYDIQPDTGRIVIEPGLSNKLQKYAPAYIGFGIIKRLVQIFPMYLSNKRVLIVSYADGCLRASLEELRQHISEHNLNVSLFSHIRTPDMGVIRGLIEHIRSQQTEVLIAIGGGTVIDVTKAAAGLAFQADSPERYLIERAPLDCHNLPVKVIAIPTLVSSGSEANDCSVYLTETDAKNSIRGLALPDVVIDPSLLVSVPLKAATISGLDGFCQVIEAYVNPNAPQAIDPISLESIRLFNRYLPSYLEGNYSQETLYNLCIAGYLHGVVNHNLTCGTGGLGLAHGLVHLCHRLNLLHGNMVSILLPSTLRFWLYKNPSVIHKLVKLKDIFNVISPLSCPMEISFKIIDYIENCFHFFLRRAGFPTSMGEINIGLSEFNEIVEYERDAILHGTLNVENRIKEEHLLMILKGVRNFSGRSETKEKITMDLVRLLSSNEDVSNLLSDGRAEELIYSILETEYRFKTANDLTKEIESRKIKHLKGLIDKHIGERYSNHMERVYKRKSLFGIC